MTIKERYEAKCQEAARWKADARALQSEVAELRRELEVTRSDRDEAVALLRDSKAAIGNLERELARVKSIPPKVEQVTQTVIAPPASFARNINGPYTAQIEALEAALGVLGARLREAGLDDSVKGHSWGSD
jgi:chromosome segregation ATPase